MITKKEICQTICTKIGIVRRKNELEFLDKRELLHVSSALDLAVSARRQREQGVRAALAQLKYGLEFGTFKSRKAMLKQVTAVEKLVEG